MHPQAPHAAPVSEPPSAASLAAVIAFTAVFASVPAARLRPNTALEADLGITGDDGVDFLDAFSARFEIDMRDYQGPHFAPEGVGGGHFAALVALFGAACVVLNPAFSASTRAATFCIVVAVVVVIRRLNRRRRGAGRPSETPADSLRPLTIAHLARIVYLKRWPPEI